MKPTLIVLILILFSCNQDNSNATALAFRDKIATGSHTLTGLNNTKEIPKANIPISEDQKIIDVLNVNLDNDVDEEQIILVNNKENLSSHLVIMVADYDLNRKTYFKSWESPTLSKANEPYNLFIEDLVGDHSQIIVLTGTDDNGYQTINLFRYNDKSVHTGLTYNSVLELSTPGNLEILRPQRTQAYDLGQKDEESYKIITETNDSNPNGLLDIIRTTYEWRFQENRYLITKTEKIPREAKLDSALAELFRGDEQALVNFISGPWYLKNNPADQSINYLSFDPYEKTFSFYSANTMEQYTWIKSTKTTRNSLLVLGSNILVGNGLSMNILITITSMDTINVEIRGNSSWTSGVYGKIPLSTQKILLNNRDPANYQRKGPSGLYKNDHGLEINFDLPFFTKVDQGVKTSGAASVFELYGLILQLKTLQDNGRSQSVENYLFTKTEEKRDLRIVRTLKLFPGKLSIRGFEPYNKDFIKLEQIEVLTSSE